MPESTAIQPSAAQQKLDRHLLLSLALSPVAAGISTVVGFTVAHWISDVGHTRMGYLVSAACFALCGVAALLALHAWRDLGNGDETHPEKERQLFMAKLALLLSALCALVVLAGVFVLVTLRPND